MPSLSRPTRASDVIISSVRRWLPDRAVHPLKLVGVFVLAVALASLAITLTRHEGRIAAIWPINAVLFVLLLKHRREEWAGLLIAFCAGTFAANLLALDGIVKATLFAAANAVEVTMATLLFVQGRRPKLISTEGVFRLFGAAAASSFVSMAMAAAGLALLGSALPVQGMALWFAADCLGYVLVAPVLLSLIDRSRRQEGKSDAAEIAVQFTTLGVLALLVFGQTQFPLLFLIPPALVWLAFSGGARRAAAGMLLVTAISLPLTLDHRGPVSLIHGGLATQVIILQIFLATNSLLCMATGAVMAERRRLLEHLGRSQARLTATSQRQTEMLGKAQLAEKMSGVGHWTLEVDSSEVYWSPEVYAIHGVAPEGFDPSYEDAVAFYVEGDRERVNGLIAAGIQSGEGWEFEAMLVRRSDGATRHVQALAECLMDQDGNTYRVFGVFKDITDDRKLFNDLREREEQYRILAEHSTDIIIQFGMDGKITYASPSCWILGVTPEDAIGKTPVDFVIDEDKARAAEAIRNNFSASETERGKRRQFRARNFFGEIIWLEGNPQVILDDAGRSTSVISTFRDVTERVERESALADARADAEAAANAKAEFLANMSHEIRTPLNGLLGFTQLLAQTSLSDDQQHFVNRISGAGRTLRELVDDILDFSKIESGKMEVEAVAFNLGDVISEVIELVDVGRADASVPITRTIDLGEASLFVGDEIKLRQIVTNIVGNAAKFTQAGSIHVTAEYEFDRVRIKVRDTGTGIPASKLDSVFEGFRQADSSVTRRFGGTGLGLSISRSLARLMGGDIEIESREGEGTLVCVSIPFVAKEAGPELAAPIGETADASRSVRVMVVDDVEINLELVRLGLKAAGHTVATFSSAQKAVDDIKAGNDYDVILMDVQMPDMDGPTAARMIRTLPGRASQTPIVAMTAHALPSDVSAFLAAGMDSHFPKPIDLDKLDQLICKLSRLTPYGKSGSASAVIDPMQQLRLDYRVYLSTVAGELRTIFGSSSDDQVLAAVLALAHAIAGTAGSLGFDEVSEEAFALEALVKRFRAASLSPKALQPKLDTFLHAVSNACA